jgi:hypothetical protein
MYLQVLKIAKFGEIVWLSKKITEIVQQAHFWQQ